MLNNTELSKIAAKCRASKESWNSYYFEAMCYTQPERNYIWREKGGFPGNTKQIPLFTQVGKNGTDIFVARIQNKLSPYEKPYISFVPKKSLEADYVEELRDFCAAMSDKCNERKNELKLDDILSDSYYDLVIGSAMIMRENTADGIRFKKIPFTDYMLGTEEHQSVVRDFKISACKVGVIFPELMNRPIIGGVDTKGVEKYNEIPLNDILFYNEQTKLWEYYLRDGEEVILTRRYRTSPYHKFHWAKAADMPYGTGVALKAVPALKRLNSYVKIKLELIPFAFPMFLTQSGNFMDRNVNFRPGGMINVRDINAMKPVELSTDKSTFVMEIETEELQIKQTFLDYMLPTNPRQMTAAEVYARSNPQDEMVSMNVSRLTSVIKDMAWDLFNDVYDRELAGTMNLTQEQLRALLDVEINNESTVDTNLIDKMNGFISTVGQFDPEAVWQGLDRGKAIEAYGSAFNLPVDMRKTAEEIDEASSQAAEAQSQAAQAEVQAQMAINSSHEQDIANREMAIKEQTNG